MTYKSIKDMVPDDWWSPREETFFSEVYYRGDHSIEGWLEDEYLSVEQRTHREVSGVIKILALKESDIILDVPCGWGKHTLALAAQGFNVTGLDISPYYLSLARSRRRAYGYWEKPYFREGDMRKLPFKSNRFTILLNLVLSFGFFNNGGNEQTLKDFARVLEKGGKCLIHTDINPAKAIKGTYKDRGHRHLMDGSKLIVSEEYDNVTKHLYSCWTIVQPSGKKIVRYAALRIYSNQEMEMILKEAGMELEGVFGALDDTLSPYTEDTQEVVYVARKIR